MFIAIETLILSQRCSASNHARSDTSNFTLYVYLQQNRIFSLAVSGSEHDSCFLKSILPVI